MNVRTICIALGLCGLLGITHCTSQARTICENERKCSGGNDADEDACVASRNATEEVAEAYDCGDPFEKYADCLETAPCAAGRIDGTACAPLRKALSDCQDAASARKGSGSASSGNGNNESSSGAVPDAGR